jgi:proteasome accessory factor C
VARPGAEQRLRRILAVIPWVAAQDGPALAEVCARFGYPTERELQEDLDLLFLCGVPPYTPDALIEVDVADGRVWIRYADWFDRPLRLTAAEALTVVAASAALLGEPVAGGGSDLDSPLARGLAKLARAVGAAEDVVDVALGPAPADVLGVLREASRAHRQVEIDYYVYGRDEQTTRVIDPHQVYSAAGQWYVAGFCHLAGADRLFRVDRVRAVRPLPSEFPARPRGDLPPLFEPSAADPVVVLVLEQEASWAASQYPLAGPPVDLGDGRIEVTLYASGEAWLARLLLRLGPNARLVSGDAAPAVAAAARVTARYRGGPRSPIGSR